MGCFCNTESFYDRRRREILEGVDFQIAQAKKDGAKSSRASGPLPAWKEAELERQGHVLKYHSRDRYYEIRWL